MTTNKKIESKKIFKNFLNYDLLFTVIIFAIIFIILANPQKFTNGTISGLKLFVFSVLPGLFPFMLLTKLLTEIGFIFKISQKLDNFSYKIFGTPGVSIYCFLMSILSGYPIGAKIISDLSAQNLINHNEAKKMTIFCTTSGPIFVIAAVGISMFKSYKIGIILYLSHILSSLILGICYNLITKKNNQLKQYQTSIFKNDTKKENIVSNCINQTINSLFVVAAYITIFYLIGEILTSLNVFKFLSSALFPLLSKLQFNKSHINGLIFGILEVTRATKELSIIKDSLSVILASGLISFSGLSIIFQSMAFLKTAKIKAHTFICFKCVHMIVSMFLCSILIFVF